MNDDALFRALADASRRQLLDRLHAKNGQTVGELCRGVNAGAKMHRRTGVKMHHDGPAAEAQFSRTI
jgi:DNA-binding transcriptional ArsR family regulator